MSNKPTEGIVKIHGKEYKTVALRVAEFRQNDETKSYGLVTEVMQIDESKVMMRCTVFDPQGRALATGHAEEWRSASKINRTSALENAETSAIGRALASLGLGGTEFASANEVIHAIEKQETFASPEDVDVIIGLMNDGTITEQHLTRAFGHANPSKLLASEAARILSALETAKQQQQ